MEDVALQVRNGNILGKSFKTNLGIPQGDCLSPVLFTLYLAKALAVTDQDTDTDHTYAKLNVNSENILPHHFRDHSYSNKKDIGFSNDQQFADDISYMNTNKGKNDYIKQSIPKKLGERNLIINENKTEEYDIKLKQEDWKNCKYLGSFLDTDKDIKHRKQLSMAAFIKYQNLLTSKKLSVRIRLRIFNAYVSSIFLYNSETWTLSKKSQEEVDVFHRNLLRKILQIKYPHTIRNEMLYIRTKEKKWSSVIKCRRLRLSGHILRMETNTPVRKALSESSIYYKNQKNWNKLTWISQINNDLKSVDQSLSFERASVEGLAEDREWWETRVVLGALQC
jgi:hypothetical protein